MQQQIEFVKSMALCLFFVGLVLVQVFVPLLKLQSGSNKFKNIVTVTVTFLRNLLIALSCFVCIFIFAQKNALPAPGWAIPFTVVFLDFISYFWHFLSHRWRTGNYFHSSNALAHMTDVWQSLIPRLMIVWGMRLPIEGLVCFELILVGGYLLEIALRKSPAWVEGVLSTFLVTPMLVAHHYTLVKGRPTRKNFGIVFSFWDRIFGTYVAPHAPNPEVVMAYVQDIPSTGMSTFSVPGQSERNDYRANLR